MNLPATGRCRCDRLRFEITVPPLLTSACHCRGCQRMTGGPFSLSVAVPAQGFRITHGEDVTGGADPQGGHRFCGHCLSWVFTRPPMTDAFVNVRATMLDDVPTDPPFVETWTATRLAWVETGAAHAFPGFPEMDAWGPLIEAYAARQ